MTMTCNECDVIDLYNVKLQWHRRVTNKVIIDKLFNFEDVIN